MIFLLSIPRRQFFPLSDLYRASCKMQSLALLSFSFVLEPCHQQKLDRRPVTTDMKTHPRAAHSLRLETWDVSKPRS